MPDGRRYVVDEPMGPATPADIDAILALVAASGLPLDGLRDYLHRAPDATVVMRRPDGSVSACGVLETYGRFGLLRSVAVSPEQQSGGRGGSLVRRMLDLARARGLDEVFLLTETAAPFFASLGFLPVSRGHVPDDVRSSAEFASVCPASAQVMAYSLESARAGQHARPADIGDLDAIVSIYNEGIEDRLGTFETQPRTRQDCRAWFDGRHPIVVVPSTGDLVAFSATFDYRPRACYAGVAEFSVYTARAYRGQGYGRLALDGLITAAARAGFWKLISRVFVENTPSRRLMRHLGFREVGIYERHGRLDGQWRDVVVVERLLGEAAR